MSHALSKTQIDRLGDRLRSHTFTETDLKLLDEYRRSFHEAYESVAEMIRKTLHLEPTGRPAKSTGSIVEKLRRESIRLSQMQDIAGCRVVVADVAEQDRTVDVLGRVFASTDVMDRREKPSFGYRAVHVIVKTSGKPIEIQVRTSLQHLWAELSEKLSDVINPAIKYGGGGKMVQNLLSDTSERVQGFEHLERELLEIVREDLNKDHLNRIEKIKIDIREAKIAHDKRLKKLLNAFDQ